MNRSKIVIVAAALAFAAALIAPAGSSAWAPAKSAAIHPGVQVFTEGAQCTSNFVFEEGSSVYWARPHTARVPAGRRKPTAAAAPRCRSARRSK